MRWPWQRKADAPKAAEIEEHAAKSDKVLRRVRSVLSEAVGPGSQAERRLVDDYARADLERRRRSKP